MNSAVEYYYSLNPTQFPVIEGLEILQPENRETNIPQISLHLRLRPNDKGNNLRLELTFTGVRDFRFQPHVNPWRFLDLQIANIEDWQWEGVSYKVIEAEQDIEFAFICATFKAELHDPEFNNVHIESVK